MVPNAVEVGQELGITDDPFGVVPEDPRITKSGRVLRRTGLDELPQLVNILRGEMSVVGPRPDLVEQVANYTEADRRRLAVRPGLTGWSQTHGREEIGWPERIEQDVWYIDHWSLWLDLKIVALTFAQVFRLRPGARRGHDEHRAGPGCPPTGRTTGDMSSPRSPPGSGTSSSTGSGSATSTSGSAYLESARLLGQGRSCLPPPRRRVGRRRLPVPRARGSRRLLGRRHADGLRRAARGGREPPVDDFFDAYERWCGERRVVATFARFQPALANQRLAEGRWHLEHIGHSIGWRVGGPGADEIVDGLDAHHRRVVRKARRAGIEVTVEERPAELDAFVVALRGDDAPPGAPRRSTSSPSVLGAARRTARRRARPR